jgi:DNA-binding HxlR family transcriptional regulator
MKTIKPRSNCPISYVADLLGDKWTLLILRDMMFYDKSSYSEFLNSTEKIASNILNNRLNLLQREGFVTKRTAPKNQSKFLYSLTGKAIALVPMMLELIEWGSTFSTFGAPKVLVTQLAKKRSKTIRELQQKLTKNSLENSGLNAETKLS